MTPGLVRQTDMMKRISLVAGVFFLVLVASVRGDDAVTSAQQALKDQGFYYGKITGRKDADTIAAIRRYQIRNGLKITGELNTETQRSLRLTPSAAPTTVPQRPSSEPPDLHQENVRRSPISPDRYRAPRGPSAPTYAPEPYSYRETTVEIFEGTPYAMASPNVQQRVIADAQIFLARRGYYRSEIDGIYGPGTDFALRAFQSGIGLPLNGRLDTPTLRALGLMPGRSGPRSLRSPSSRALPRRVYRGEWIPD